MGWPPGPVKQTRMRLTFSFSAKLMNLTSLSSARYSLALADKYPAEARNIDQSKTSSRHETGGLPGGNR
jgi:hypothetical protein